MGDGVDPGDSTFPTIFEDNLEPFPRPILIDSIRSIYYVEKYIIEKRLKCRDGSLLLHEQRREGIRSGEAESKYLAAIGGLKNIQSALKRIKFPLSSIQAHRGYQAHSKTHTLEQARCRNFLS